MDRLWALTSALLLTACQSGPFRVTHEKGHMPKLRVELPQGSLHARTDGDELIITYKLRFR